MQFSIDKIKTDYKSSKDGRELGKWFFSVATLGLGALYLWATTRIINEGEIGLRKTAKGKMVLLPPGRHSNFPWEEYPAEPKSLAKDVIELGPYKVITVKTGYKANTFQEGKLVILEEGQHLLESAAHTFSGFVSVKQETERLEDVIAFTKDNISMTVNADVIYQIEDPFLATKEIDHIVTTIKDRARVTIATTVHNHELRDFASATTSDTQLNTKSLLQELFDSLNSQFQLLGIKLINIGIINTVVTDKNLAQQLGQTTVQKTQIESQLLAADNAAKVRKLQADAECYAITKTATAQADAIRIIGGALEGVAQKIGNSETAKSIYKGYQRTEMVKNAQNCNLFFSQKSGDDAGLPKLVTTVPSNSVSSLN